MMRKSAPVRFGSIDARPPLAAPGQRIGLLGGSFNPPHAGHRLVVDIALRRLGLDQIWMIVTPGNPLKGHGALRPLDERMAACRALVDDPRVVVTDFEAALGTPFTAATLSYLLRRYPETRFVWVMGADNLPGFHRWQQWREIFESLPIAVVDRPGFHLKALASKAAQAYRQARWPERKAAALAIARPPAWTLLTGPLSELSSTAIRAARGASRPRSARTSGSAE
jgi:nicotinate-nucleotide adenylyltransferase